MGVAVLLVILVWLVAQSSRRAFEAQARTFADGLAGVAQVNIQSEFDRVDSVIKVTAVEVEELLAEPSRTTDAAINKLLARRFNLLAGVEAIRPSDTAARLGSDEFVLVLACVEDEDWRPVVDRVVQLIGEPVELEPTRAVKVGVTPGVTLVSPDDAATAQELIERADHVMLEGKRAGKGRVCR